MRGDGTPCSLEGDRGSSPGIFFKIYVSENAFKAILKPFFPYSLTSILSKVRHPNPRGRGGGTLIFSCMGRRGLFLGVQNFEF